jgi:hypothetical protein
VWFAKQEKQKEKQEQKGPGTIPDTYVPRHREPNSPMPPTGKPCSISLELLSVRNIYYQRTK